MQTQKYITETEHEKCLKIKKAFLILEAENIVVLDAGKFGFVKLSYYYTLNGFDTVETFTDSQDLFNNLWLTWLNMQIAKLSLAMGIEDMSFEDAFKCLPIEKQKELMNAKDIFAQKAYQ